MKLSAKHLFATLGMLTVFAVTPTTAFASGSVHINVPGFSIGFHDVHHSHKRYRKHYRGYYNDDYRYERRKYRKKRNRYYKKRRYYDNYYSSGRRYDRGYDRKYNRRYERRYNDGYRAEACPIDGYSRYDDRGQNCYEHKDHYHCS